MAEPHYCNLHKVKFYFNKGIDGKPDWWSHAIKGTGKYCNEKLPGQGQVATGQQLQEGAAKAPVKEVSKDKLMKSLSKEETEREYWERKNLAERESIERQTAVKIAFQFASSEGYSDSFEGYMQTAQKIFNWIHTGDMPNGSKIPETENKATVANSSEQQVDKKILLDMVKSKMAFRTDGTALSWLRGVNQIPQERIDKETGIVAHELRLKYGWAI